VVLDTHVLLSGLAYPGSIPGRLIAAWRHGALDVVLSDPILEELGRTLPKLTHRHGLLLEPAARSCRWSISNRDDGTTDIAAVGIMASNCSGGTPPPLNRARSAKFTCIFGLQWPSICRKDFTV
jgi:hypothetical protein